MPVTDEMVALYREAYDATDDFEIECIRAGLETALTEAIKEAEHSAIERAIDKMGWLEIHAFQDELSRGQDVCEDAGGFMMRAIRRLFGLPSNLPSVTTYQDAARAMVRQVKESGNGN